MGIVKDLARSPRPKGAAGATLEGLYLTLAPGKIVEPLKGSIFQIEPPNGPFERNRAIRSEPRKIQGVFPLDPHKR